ncbi:hypothetical protein [Sphingomonas sp. KR3-1]|uniref:hypothetical protein n=1 Tax=Sphingomonas sp. KR3-1 TaxID=3156611 RepID=UPI0032B4632B
MRDSMKMCAVVAAAGLALSACGGGKAANGSETGSASEGTTAVAAADFNPCSLITAEEMTAITTDKVNSLDRRDASCTYKANPDDGVQTTVYVTEGAKHMEIMHRSAKLLGGMGASVADKGGAGADVANQLKEDKSATPALGDEAMWSANNTLVVRKGDAYIEVTPPFMHDPANHSGYPLIATKDKRAIAVAVATKLLEKLPAR